MSIRLRITSLDGGSQEVVLKDGQAMDVTPGQRIEVLAETGVVVSVVVQGEDIVLRMPSGEHVVLAQFVPALASPQPPELVLPELREIAVRLIDAAGVSQVVKLGAGTRLEVPEGSRAEVLGMSLPDKLVQDGRDLTFETPSGKTFTLGNVLADTGVPREGILSFPDLYVSGEAGAVPLQTVSLLPLGLVPLAEEVRRLDAAEGPAPKGEVVALEAPPNATDLFLDGMAGNLLKPPPSQPQEGPVFEDLAGGIAITRNDLAQLGDAGTSQPAGVDATAPAVADAQPDYHEAVLIPHEPDSHDEPADGDVPPEDVGVPPSHLEPEPPGLNGLTPASDSGPLAADGVTNQAAPTLVGKAEAFGIVTVYVDGVSAGQAPVDGNGDWRFTFPGNLADGSHSVTVTVTDAGGAVSAPSAPLALTVDTAIAAPAIAAASDSAISGTAEPGATMSVTVAGQTLTTTADASTGAWAVTPGPIVAGSYTVTVTATDAAGNSSASSQSLTVSGGLPGTPSSLAIGPDTGASGSDGITDDLRPTFSGQADPNATVTLTLTSRTDGSTLTLNAIADGAGNWYVQPPSNLAQHTYDVSVTAQDGSGGTSASATMVVTIDATAPAAPTVTGISPDTGAGAGDFITADRRPAFSGTAEPLAEVTVAIGGQTLTTSAAADGSWSVAPGADLADGTYSAVVTTRDAAGNVGASATQTVVIDGTVTAPFSLAIAPDSGISASDGITDNLRPTFSGQTDANAAVTLTLTSRTDGSTLTLNATADGSGNWNVQPPSNMAQATYDVSVVSQDDVGNTSAPTAMVVTIDATAPSAPVVTGISPDTGASASDYVTADRRPAFNGTAEAGAEVTVVVDGQTLTTTAAGDGSWSVAPGADLADGSYAAVVTTRDAAGNVGPSATQTIVIDGTATPPSNLAIAPDNGTSASDGITNVLRPTISGLADANAPVTVTLTSRTDGSTLTLNATADVAGNWSVQPPGNLAQHTYDVSVTAQDALGNTSAPTAMVVTIDTTAPAAPTVTSITPDTGASSTDFVTAERRPAFNGTAEADAEVTVAIGAQTLTTTAAADGSWTLPLEDDLPNGIFTAVVTTRDAAGNVGASASQSVEINSLAPMAPVITGLTGGTDTGVFTNDGVTNDSTPTIAGTTEPGAQITVVELDGSGAVIRTLTTVTANAVTGAWTVTLPVLSEAAHRISATATNLSGLTSNPAVPRVITVDLTSPPIHSSSPDLAASSDSGASSTDNLTNDTTPTIIGTAGPGDYVNVVDNGVFRGRVLVQADGTWSFTPTAGAAWADGTHSITARALDLAGNSHTAGPALVVTVDTAVTIANNGITDATDTGRSATDDITKNTLPELGGTVEANATVEIYQSFNGGADVLIATLTNTAGGTWNHAFATPLAEGNYVFTARATDLAGNTSLVAHSVVVDTTAPGLPTVAGLEQTSASDSGLSNSDGITSTTRPFITGTSEPNAWVEVFGNDGVTVIAAGAADAAGNWRLQPTVALPQGTHTFTARATDLAGNVGPQTPTGPTITVDTQRPATKPFVADLVDAFDSGVDSTDNITKDRLLTFTGNAPTGEYVHFWRNGVRIADYVPVQPDGTWTYSIPTSLADGTYNIQVMAVDVAGNQTLLSDPLVVTVDNKATAPIIDGLSAATDSNVVGDGVTNIKQPAITGTAEPLASLDLYRQGPGDPSPIKIATVSVDATGHWSYAVTADMVDGTHLLTAISTDRAGNVSPSSVVCPIEIDTVAPVNVAPQVLGAIAATDTGESATDGNTSVPAPTLYGTATLGGQPYALINLYSGGTWDPVTHTLSGATFIGKVRTDAAGNWALPLPNPLAEGANTIRARETDLAGNEGDSSAPFTVTIDTLAPAKPVVDGLTPATDTGSSTTDRITNLAAPTLSGTAEPGSLVTVFNGKTLVGTVYANAGGAWTLPLSANLSPGSHSFTAVSRDAAGNQSVDSDPQNVVYDATPPAAPSGLALTTATDTGVIKTDRVTKNAQPVLTGRAEPNAMVEVFVDGASQGTTQANATGTWQLPVPAPLAEGAHTFTARATDLAGNAGALSAAQTLTIDLTGPGATTPTIDFIAPETDTGRVFNDGITADLQPTLVGGAPAGAIVAVYVDGSNEGYTTADPVTGAWRLELAPLAQGSHTVVARVSDAAGNESPDSNSLPLTIDVTAPAAPAITALDGSPVFWTSAYRPTLSGTAEKNAVLQFYDTVDGETVFLGETTVDGAGNWSYRVPTALTSLSHQISVVAIDLAGNVSAPGTRTVVVDYDGLGQPQLLAGLTEATDTGYSPSDGVTAHATPTLYGTATPGASVEIYEGATLLGSVTADGVGHWELPTALGNGTHIVQARELDGMSAVVRTSVNYPVVVDRNAPAGTPVVTGLAPFSDTGDSATDKLTALARPMVYGTTTPNMLVQVFFNGVSQGLAVSDASGAWFFQPGVDLPSGTYDVTARNITQAGVGGAPSAAPGTPTFTVDVDAPATPVVTGITGATDSNAPDGVTSFVRPVIVGSGPANHTVEVYANGDLLGTTIADGGGNWSFTPTTDLDDGSQAITATALDLAGNESGLSAATTIVIAAHPGAPVVTGLDSATDGGALGDGLTNVSQPVIEGSAFANALVTVYDGATLLGSVTADAAGDWSFLVPVGQSLAHGSHTIRATATNGEGVVSPLSSSFALSIDLVAPTNVPVYGGLRQGSDSGVSSTDGVTAMTMPTLGGTHGVAGAPLEIYLQDATDPMALPVRVGGTSVKGDGTWVFQPRLPIADGAYTISVHEVDAAGNLGPSPVGPQMSLVIDTQVPAVAVTGLGAGSDTGVSNTDRITSDNTPTIVGTSASGATVSVYAGGMLVGTTTADGAGNWSITQSGSPLPEGAIPLTAKAVDLAGNMSALSAPVVMTVDTLPPTEKAGVPVLDPASDTGSVGDGVTGMTTPTLTGTVSANAYVHLYDGAVLIAQVQADAAGAWRYTPGASFAPNAHSLTARVADGAGNEGPASTALSLTIDPLAPRLSTASATLATGTTVQLKDYVTGTDSNTPAGSLIYTLQTGSDTDNGLLFVDTNGDGVAERTIGVGGTFTQTELNAGYVKYRHDTIGDDHLILKLSDGAGSAVAEVDILQPGGSYRLLDPEGPLLDYSALGAASDVRRVELPAIADLLVSDDTAPDWGDFGAALALHAIAVSTSESPTQLEPAFGLGAESGLTPSNAYTQLLLIQQQGLF